jgi:hypothetical protein
MHMTANDAAHVRMCVDDAPESGRVAQRDAIEPRAPHRQRVVVHCNEHVLAGVLGQRFAQALQPRGTEPAGVLAGEEGAQQYDRPWAATQLAAELKRAAAEDLAQQLRIVVVPRYRVDGYAERLEHAAKALVTGAALVLHDVARCKDRVHGPTHIALRMREHGEQRCVSRDAPHAAIGGRMQVGIADLEDRQGFALAIHAVGAARGRRIDDTQLQ